MALTVPTEHFKFQHKKIIIYLNILKRAQYLLSLYFLLIN